MLVIIFAGGEWYVSVLCRTRGVFGEDGAVLGDDFPGDRFVRPRINLVNWGTENGYGNATSIETTAVSNSVNTISESGHNNNALLSEFIG